MGVTGKNNADVNREKAEGGCKSGVLKVDVSGRLPMVDVRKERFQ